MFAGERKINGNTSGLTHMPTMQLQQQLSQQQHELLQQLQLLQHQYLMHHGINLQTLFLAQQHNKSPQKHEGKCRFAHGAMTAHIIPSYILVAHEVHFICIRQRRRCTPMQYFTRNPCIQSIRTEIGLFQIEACIVHFDFDALCLDFCVRSLRTRFTLLSFQMIPTDYIHADNLLTGTGNTLHDLIYLSKLTSQCSACNLIPVNNTQLLLFLGHF